jgi:hypothetical protein
LWRKTSLRIQNGNWRAEADSMSSINQKHAEILEPHLAEKKHQEE